MSLHATEVKAIMHQGSAQIRSAYAMIDRGEVFIINMNIPRYIYAGKYNHEPNRSRKLLLHKHEINKMMRAQEKFHTLVPTEVYITHNRKIKVSIALCEGKKLFDKRHSIKQKEMMRRKAVLTERFVN